MAKSEDVIGVARTVGVVLLNLEIGLVIEQAIEDVSGIANGRTDCPGMKRSVAIRDVSIKHRHWIAAILGVHLRDDWFAEGDGKGLPVGGRGASAAPSGSKRDLALQLDNRR